MPPRIKYCKQAVLDAAFDITRRSGIEAVNARAIASALGCSTQPLFREFESMDQIRDEMARMAREKYNSYIANSPSYADNTYKGTGMAYILFSRDEPQLFKLLFMRDRIKEGKQNGFDDDNMDYIVHAIMERTGYTRDQAYAFHNYMSIFAHGVATMIATKFIEYDHDEINRLLSGQFNAVKQLFAHDASEYAAIDSEQTHTH